MQTPGRWVLLAAGILFAALYVVTSVRQRETLNLSMTAGGQYPYFQNAAQMATEGLSNYLGDRNRMPLIPGLLSFLHSKDRQQFFDRGRLFAIFSSILLVLIIAAGCFLTLPAWPAMFLTGLCAVQVFLPKSSFVQAELAYYAFSFAAWLLMCIVLQTASLKWAVAAAVALALAFYSKASATPMLALFLVVLASREVANRRNGRPRQQKGTGETYVGSGRRAMFCGAAVVLGFVILAMPYLMDNKSRFGHYFYNVNSTFFMWMDSWAEAQQFAARHDISNRFPVLPADAMPGLGRYLQMHDGAQIWRRFVYGATTLAGLVLASAYLKYFVIILCVFLLLFLLHPAQGMSLWRIHRFAAIFTILVLLAYATVYSWYAVVSFGDRFVLSLFLPVMFALTWGCVRLSSLGPALAIRGRRCMPMDVLAASLVLLLLVEGMAMATVSIPRPNERFVEFYFNESRETYRAGDAEAAVAGYHGVIRLDPRFAPAHHELAIVALRGGRLREAIELAKMAAELEPGDANYLNTYGSALLQAGFFEDSAGVLASVVEKDPNFASAWYNLGVAYASLGITERVHVVLSHLDRLDPRLAEQLKNLVIKVPAAGGPRGQ